MVMLSFICAQTLCAQEKKDSVGNAKERYLSVTCGVADHITHEPMNADTLRGELILAADSSFVDTVKVDNFGWGDWKETQVSAKVTKPGKYFIRLFYVGYEPKYVPFEVKKLYKNELYMELKKTYMRRQKKFEDMELDEVVVKATKLKFYMDGDTLVYDADAFSMAEGSMLGQLIKKLPGVEVEKGGEIKVNGKKVDAMLLNGKDFFDSDRELLLNNMPTYMVKNVQSYERVPENAKGTNKEKTTQKELVMNVKLKREYNAGWLVTATGGAGTTFFKNEDGKHDSRYLGRLFATRFDDRSRFIVYAGTNNLNDQQIPGENGNVESLTQSTGITKTYMGGMNFYRDWNEEVRYLASVSGSYTDTDSETRENTETFLEGGNTFGRSFNNSNARSWSVNTNHTFFAHKTNNNHAFYKNYHFQLNPNFSYTNNKNRGNAASLTLAQDVANDLGKAWMDSIMAPNAGELIRKFGINRSISNSYNYGHNTNATVNGDFGFTPAHNDVFDFSMRYNYAFADSKSEQFNHDTYEYPNSAVMKDDFRNKYAPNFNRSHSFSISPDFSFMLNRQWGNFVSVNYLYSYNYNESNQSLYLLNKLDEWNNPDAHQIGNLPSMDEMLQTLDKDNSSVSKTRTNTHNVHLTYGHSFIKDENSKKFSQVFVNVLMPIKNEKIDYQRGAQVDTLLSRNTLFVNPSVMYMYSDSEKFRSFNASYSMDMSAPSLMSMISFVDTSDPLMETHNNPNLKNTATHTFEFNYRDKFGRTLFNIDLNSNIIQNQVASGFIYNKETGKRIVTPENVNGNWSFSANSSLAFAFDKDEKWRLTEKLNYSYNNSVDLSGTCNEEDMDEAKATRSVVGSNNIGNMLKLTWRPSDKMEFNATTNIHYQNSTSERQDFTTLNVFDFNYGLSGKVELPLGFQVASDVTMYSRRGYSDNTMNTNEFVWNFRVSKKFMKGNLLVQADAFDVLGNLTNVRRTINAQGKVETFSNVIPSYFLIHLTYRFNKYPKNKKM